MLVEFYFLDADYVRLCVESKEFEFFNLVLNAVDVNLYDCERVFFGWCLSGSLCGLGAGGWVVVGCGWLLA